MTDNSRALRQIHDAILAELSMPKSPHLTVAQNVTFKARLRYIIQHGGDDPEVASRLFKEAIDGL